MTESSTVPCMCVVHTLQQWQHADYLRQMRRQADLAMLCSLIWDFGSWKAKQSYQGNELAVRSPHCMSLGSHRIRAILSDLCIAALIAYTYHTIHTLGRLMVPVAQAASRQPLSAFHDKQV